MSLLATSRIIAFAATRDLARAKEFYVGQLGLPLVSQDTFAVVCNAHGTMLRITPVQQLSAAPYTVLGWEVTDIAAAAAELQQRGIAMQHFPGLVQDALGIWNAPGGLDKVAWFKDPDGNILSISQHGSAS